MERVRGVGKRVYDGGGTKYARTVLCRKAADLKESLAIRDVSCRSDVPSLKLERPTTRRLHSLTSPPTFLYIFSFIIFDLIFASCYIIL